MEAKNVHGNNPRGVCRVQREAGYNLQTRPALMIQHDRPDKS
jgi:hypothetical protein